MPLFYWRSTYGLLRERIRTRFNVDDFDTAFQQFSARLICPQNMLYQFALKHQPDKYALNVVAGLDRAHLPKMIGTNKPDGTYRVQQTCCRLFNLSTSICPNTQAEYDADQGLREEYITVHSYLNCLEHEMCP